MREEDRPQPVEPDAQPPIESGPGGVLFLGLVLIAAVIALIMILASTSDPNTWYATVLAIVLIVLTLPSLIRQSARERKRRLLAFLILALFLKLFGSVARQYVSVDIYEGKTDDRVYHEQGVILAKQFRTGDFSTGHLDLLNGTDFIRFTTGLIYTVIGPSRYGGGLVYSWLGFLGLFYFYRAYVIAVPDGRRRSYARLLFFLPTLVFWPSDIGKDAWMMFTLGITALGAAHILTRRMLVGGTVLALGLWLGSMVRPHIMGLVAIALGVAYLVRPSRKELQHLAPIAKVIASVVLAGVALFMVQRADEFLQEKGLDPSGGVQGVLTQTQVRTSRGGSQFSPSVLSSPARAPEAVATVLYRPFLIEVTDTKGLLAALEMSFIFAYSVWRFPSLWAGIRGIRQRPYVAMALVATALLILAFSSIANFGILARQRAQLLPFYLIPFTISKRKVTDVEPAPDRDLQTVAG